MWAKAMLEATAKAPLSGQDNELIFFLLFFSIKIWI